MNPILLHGDCIEWMDEIAEYMGEGEIDLCLTDPPYGTTACKWDSVIEFEPMWEQFERIVKPNGAICLFGSEPFSSALRISNIKIFKYDWVWFKNTATGISSAKYRPMKRHEIISVFCRGRHLYNKQPAETRSELVRSHAKKGYKIEGQSVSQHSNKFVPALGRPFKTSINPSTVLEFKTVSNRVNVHPTQKPVALLEYLIKTYTKPGETVFDFTMGSGSTGVACANTGRKFIGIEKDEKYFNIASKRIAKSYSENGKNAQ